MLQIEMTDEYDFTDYKELREIINNNDSLTKKIGAVANNLAMISTSCNVMHEYSILIKFDVDNWDE